MKITNITLLLISCMLIQGCGTIVSTAADVTIEVAKVPFKVAGAAIDVVSDGDDDDE